MRLQWLGWLLVVLVGCREANAPGAPPAKKVVASSAPTKAAPAPMDAVKPDVAKADASRLAANQAAAAKAAVISASAAMAAADEAAAKALAKPPVPEQLLKRIRYQLRELSPAPIALRDAAIFPSEDGGSDVVGFYEYSVYEDCVKRDGGSRTEARQRCLAELGSVTVGMPDGANGEVETRAVRLNRHCKRYGLVYAHVGPDPDAAKGPLTVEHKALSEEDCELSSLQELSIEDRDGDGRRELVADMTFAFEAFGDQRSGDDVVDKAIQRVLWVLKLEPGLPAQFEERFGDRRIGNNAELQWVDLNRDGRKDFVYVVDCNGRSGAGGTSDECDLPVRDRVWYLYDRELDEWHIYEPDADDAKALDAEGAP